MDRGNPKPRKTSRPLLVMTCGIPGSGKTTWRKAYWRGRVVCPDEIRQVFYGKAMDYKHDREVWVTAYRWTGYWLSRGEDVLFDATNVSVHRRAELISCGKTHGARVQAVVFEISVEEALLRNSKRPDPVPEEVILRMASAWVPPTREEDIDEIIYVNP